MLSSGHQGVETVAELPQRVMDETMLNKKGCDLQPASGLALETG
jgi:hypothetical protein